MPSGYLKLALKRATAQCAPYKQVEAFGYDFSMWVSPYTKGAHAFGGFALVLQDWASEDRLAGTPDPLIRQFGRAPLLLTNVRLEQLLCRVLGLGLSEVYATNAFPFVKPGRMSSALKKRDVECAVRTFTVKEIRISKAKTVLALGRVAYDALRANGVECVRLPHPAARMGLSAHEDEWRSALGAAGVRVREGVSQGSRRRAA
jgi:hypothetical protein